MKKEFIVKPDIEIPDKLLTSLYEQVHQLKGKRAEETIKNIISLQIDSSHCRIIGIADKYENEVGGFAIFDQNFIRFFYISSSIPAKKYASFILTEAVLKEMQENGTSYIVSYFPRLEKYLDEEDLSTSLQLLEFSSFIKFDVRAKTGRILHISRNHDKIYKNISFYSYLPDEHKKKVLQLMIKTGDYLVDNLFSGLGNKEIIEDYYCKTVFLDEGGKEVEFSSDCSTVAFDKSGIIAGFLLCKPDGEIISYRLPRIKGINPVDVLYLMVERAAEKLKFDGKAWITMSYFDRDRQVKKAVGKVGFREINEYMVWSWSKFK